MQWNACFGILRASVAQNICQVTSVTIAVS